MKRKIICLAITVVCLIAMLASCSGSNACTAHADADKNSVCDSCGIPVVTIIEKVPTEVEVVDMVVATIPSATLGDAFNTATEKTVISGQFLANENVIKGQNDLISERFLYYWYVTQTDGLETTEENWPTAEEYTGTEPYTQDGYLADDRYTTTWVVYDLLAKKNVFTFTSAKYADDGSHPVKDIESITLVDGLIKVVFRKWEYTESIDFWHSIYSNVYYFTNGTLFVDAEDVEEGDVFFPPVFEREYDGVSYFVLGDTKYALDLEAGKVLATGSVDTFINRPYFDEMTDTHGFVVMNDTVYVYDLTKWIECVNAYELPAFYDDYWFLANGNLLVQEVIALPDSAVNYDYADGAKYDLVHTVVDLVNKTETGLELGYSVCCVDVAEEDSIYAAAVKNILHVYPIVDKSVNYNKDLYLLCDDALAIIAEEDAVNPDFVNGVTLIADGIFKGEVVYGEGSAVTKLYNAKGEEIATLPNNATIRSTYILADGKYYDFTMKLLFDPNANMLDPYRVFVDGDGFLLLLKGDDVYYWNAKLEAPVLIADATNQAEAPDGEEAVTTYPVVAQSISTYSDNWYVVETVTTTQVEGADDLVVTEYALYNAENVKLLTSSEDFSVNGTSIDGENVWIIISGDTCYFAQ